MPYTNNPKYAKPSHQVKVFFSFFIFEIVIYECMFFSPLQTRTQRNRKKNAVSGEVLNVNYELQIMNYKVSTQLLWNS